MAPPTKETALVRPLRSQIGAGPAAPVASLAIIPPLTKASRKLEPRFLVPEFCIAWGTCLEAGTRIERRLGVLRRYLLCRGGWPCPRVHRAVRADAPEQSWALRLQAAAAHGHCRCAASRPQHPPQPIVLAQEPEPELPSVATTLTTPPPAAAEKPKRAARVEKPRRTRSAAPRVRRDPRRDYAYQPFFWGHRPWY